MLTGMGVVGPEYGKIEARRMAWESQSQRVKAPYPKAERSLPASRVPWETWGPEGISEDHLIRLNTNHRPIVHKYREGKVKRTPVRGVK